MEPARVINSSLRQLAAFCRARAIDVPSLLARAGTSDEVLAEGVSVDAAIVGAVWTEAVRSTGEPALGLVVGSAVPFGEYPIFNYLAASAETIGAGLSLAARYFRLIHSRASLELSEGDEEVVIRLEPAVLPRFYVEYVLSSYVQHSRIGSGIDWSPSEIVFRFSLESGERGERHRTVFAGPVRFGADRNAIVLPRALFDQRATRPLPGLLPFMQEQAEAALARLPRDSHEGRTVAFIAANLALDQATLPLAARALGLSSRSLQRALAAEGKTFAALVDETRRRRATELLKDQHLSLTDIAFALGFSELAAFSRAHRRWFGRSPKTTRQGGDR